MWKGSLSATLGCDSDAMGQSKSWNASEDLWLEDDTAPKKKYSQNSYPSIRTTATTLGESSTFQDSFLLDSVNHHDSQEGFCQFSLKSFGNFGDFTVTGSADNSHNDIAFDNSIQSHSGMSIGTSTSLQASGFSWEKSKVVRMLSSKAFVVDGTTATSPDEWDLSNSSPSSLLQAPGFSREKAKVVHMISSEPESLEDDREKQHSQNDSDWLIHDDSRSGRGVVSSSHAKYVDAPDDNNIFHSGKIVSIEEVAEKFDFLQTRVKRHQRVHRNSQGQERISKHSPQNVSGESMNVIKRRNHKSSSSRCEINELSSH